MIKMFLTGAALVAVAPAMAQTVVPATPVTPAVSAPVNPTGAASTMTDTTTSAATGVGAGAAANVSNATSSNPSTQVASVVESEFPTYDADKSGTLSKTEFGKWVVALKQEELKATGKTMAQADVDKWAANAFVSADIDKNKTVSKAELTTYLGG